MAKPPKRLSMKAATLCCVVFAVFLTFHQVAGNAVQYDVDHSESVPMDYALLSAPSLDPNLMIYATNAQCYKCSKSLAINSTETWSFLWTPFEWTFYLIERRSDATLAKGHYTFGDQGKYFVSVNKLQGDAYSISFTTEEDPVNSLAPLWVMMGVFIAMALVAFLGPTLKYKIKRRYWPEDNQSASVPLLSDPIENKIRHNNDDELSANARQSLNSLHSAEDKFVRADDEEVGRRSITSQQSGSKHSLHSLLDIPIAKQVQPLTSSGISTPQQGQVSSTASQVKSKPPRLNSLDTFRGFSLCLMIFVNYGGGGYWFFNHAPWHGLTVADLLFPWFMWMMGVSMALSFSAQNLIVADPALGPGAGVSGVSKFDHPGASWSVWAKVVQRSLTLFCIGLFLNDGSDYKNWRIPGVLQYFGVSYFVTSATVLYNLQSTNERIRVIKMQEKLTGSSSQQKWALHADDRGILWKLCRSSGLPSRIMIAYATEWIVQLCIVIVYLSISLGATAPGCPRGYQGPGGLSEDSAHWECTGGIHRYIDMKLFGYNHIYHWPTCQDLYNCVGYDPEGLLGMLTACTLTYLGLMTGRVLLHFKEHRERFKRWLSWSFVQLLLAGCLCGFSQFDGPIPINKNLWTTSFAFLTSGFGLLGLSFCYWTVDVLKVWSGAPFIYLGMNSILMYCGSEVLFQFPFTYEIYTKQNHANLLLMHLVGVFSWIAVAFYCYKIKFFVKV